MTVDVFILEELSYFLSFFLSLHISVLFIHVIKFFGLLLSGSYTPIVFFIIIVLFFLGLPSVPERSDMSLLHTFSMLEVYLVIYHLLSRFVQATIEVLNIRKLSGFTVILIKVICLI